MSASARTAIPSWTVPCESEHMLPFLFYYHFSAQGILVQGSGLPAWTEAAAS